MNTILFVLIGLLSAFFLFASSIKLLAWQRTIFDVQMAFMRSYGLNRQVLFLIGAVECFGSIAIWFQGSTVGTLGGLALLTTSLGAIGFHLRYDTLKDGVPAMVTATLAGMVIWLQWA